MHCVKVRTVLVSLEQYLSPSDLLGYMRIFQSVILYPCSVFLPAVLLFPPDVPAAPVRMQPARDLLTSVLTAPVHETDCVVSFGQIL